MKKIFIILLIFSLPLLFVACGDDSVEMNTTTQEDTGLGEIDSIASDAADAKVAELTNKHQDALLLVNEIYYLGFENGWQNDEEFNAELETTVAFLEVIDEDLQYPERMDIEYMDTLIKMIDEMIPTWEGLMVKVSEPYQEK